ncbi:antitoxin [Adlercreutzia aquisgranensis]|uniref:antitoxin n=1 Tax=Adlercreutzia aquisgranensis TaxID=2941323 RepID=UPI00203DC736|nr:antitoxin [Adlercreutzia aquisgranensis]
MSNAREAASMPAEIDFSESTPNPYAGRVRRRITINIDGDTVDYFKEESRRTGVPYQTIMNLYLGQCAAEGKHLTFA